MRVVIFGATGMVGQGVLRECLAAGDVEAVVTVGRTPVDASDPKHLDLVQRDLFDLGTIESTLVNLDACFFCLGVSSAGMTEANYTCVTCDLTLSVAACLSRLNPQMTFVYVSGAGTDATERGPLMWARVKGRTENALQRLPFRAVYLFRPGVIQPLHGATSKTASYRILYRFASPLLSIARWLLPKFVLTTESVGSAMLNVVRQGAPKPVLDAADIKQLAG
jgi:uncharacterized protein YbjT (DUF2867 family)